MNNSELYEHIAHRWCELMRLDPNEVIERVVYPQKKDDFVRHIYAARYVHVAREVPAQIAWVRAILEHSAEMAAEES